MDNRDALLDSQKALIDKMTESAGELLFDASAPTGFPRNVLKELAHQLGRLYGETIRACRAHDGLQDEVTTTFMCGMALEPNFGREEERPDIEAKAGADGLTHWHVKTSAPAGTRAVAALNAMLRDPGGEAQEEKTPGQVLFEKECGSTARSWDKLHLSCRMAYENKAKRDEETKTPGQLLYEGQPHGAASRPWAKLSDNSRRAFEKEAAIRAMPAVGAIRITEEEMHDPRAEEYRATSRSLYAGGLGLKAKEKAAMEAILDAPVGAPLPKDSPFATIDWDKDEEVQAKAAKKCWKCQGSGNMGFTTYMACDACE